MDLIIKLAKGLNHTEEDLSNHLFEVCENVHASCDSDCPVYLLNGNSIPRNENGGCRCFKNGSAMLEFIKEKA